MHFDVVKTVSIYLNFNSVHIKTNHESVAWKKEKSEATSSKNNKLLGRVRWLRSIIASGVEKPRRLKTKDCKITVICSHHKPSEPSKHSKSMERQKKESKDSS